MAINTERHWIYNTCAWLHIAGAINGGTDAMYANLSFPPKCCPLKNKKAKVFSRITSDGVKPSISWELLTPPFSGGCPHTAQTTTCKAAAPHCSQLTSKKTLKFFPPPHFPVQVCLGQLAHLAHMVMQTPVPVREARTSREQGQGQGEQPAPSLLMAALTCAGFGTAASCQHQPSPSQREARGWIRPRAGTTLVPCGLGRVSSLAGPALHPANSWDHAEGWKCTVQSTGWRHRWGGIKFFVRLLIVPREHNHLYTVSMAIWKMFRFKHLLQNHTISNATPLDETRDTAHRLSV